MPVARRNGTWEGRVKGAGFLPMQVLTRTFNTKGEAEAWETSRRDMVKARSMPPELMGKADGRGRRALSVGEAIRLYRSKHAVAEADDGYLDALWNDEALRTMPVASIDVTWAFGWIGKMKRERGLKPNTIKHYVGALARCFDLCVLLKDETGMIINPLRMLPQGYAQYSKDDQRAAGKSKQACHDEERTRRLEQGEEARILEAMTDDPEATLFFHLALETAMRMREMYTLAPSQIDFERRTIFLNKTKNGSLRQVPMTSVAYTLLKAWKPHTKTQLFSYWSGSTEAKALRNDTSKLSHRFATYFEQAGCPDLHFHDLRHEATCRIFERTQLRETEIMKITGHSSTRMLGRYANLRASNLATALW